MDKLWYRDMSSKLKIEAIYTKVYIKYFTRHKIENIYKILKNS